MSTCVNDSKLVSEEVLIESEFLSRLTTDTVTLGTVNVVVFAGVDPDPSLILDGAATVSGSRITQKVKGGLPGVIYLIYIAAKTSVNNVYINEHKLAVLSG